jgi:ATP-dependent DNA helicase RecG
MAHPDTRPARPRRRGRCPLRAGLSADRGDHAEDHVQGARSALARVPELPEWIDPELKRQKDWPDWHAALREAHAPEGPEDISRSAKARERLAYRRVDGPSADAGAGAGSRGGGRRGSPAGAMARLRQKVLTSLPFSPTGAQLRAIAEIEADMAADTRMSRLLQGDVGAGKTLVALMALLIAVEAGGQGVMMAPTRSSRRQHLRLLKPLAEEAGVVIEILTGRDKGRRARGEAARAGGGRHPDPRRHPCGVPGGCGIRRPAACHRRRTAPLRRGRAVRLGAKGQATDVLVMTATPIPRTLSLAQYGDMDVSVLDEKAAGAQAGEDRASVHRADRGGRRATCARAGRGAAGLLGLPAGRGSEVYDAVAAEERFAHLRAELGEGRSGWSMARCRPRRRTR